MDVEEVTLLALLASWEISTSGIEQITKECTAVNDLRYIKPNDVRDLFGLTTVDFLKYRHFWEKRFVSVAVDSQSSEHTNLSSDEHNFSQDSACQATPPFTPPPQHGVAKLRALLQNSTAGREVLAQLDADPSKKVIRSRQRYTVARLVIEEALTHASPATPPLLSGKDLTKLASACGALFKESTSVWYRKEKRGEVSPGSSRTPTPGRSQFSRPHAYGVLNDRYETLKKKWRAAHPDLHQLQLREKKRRAEDRKEAALETASRRKSIEKQTETEEEGEDTGKEIAPPKKPRGRPPKLRSTKEAQEGVVRESWENLLKSSHLQILLNWTDYTTLTGSVKTAFKESSEARLQHLLLPHADVEQYLEKFPFLTSPASACELINLDFEHLHPQVQANQVSTSVLVSSKAIIRFAERGSCYTHAAPFISAYRSSTDFVTKAGAALLALPFATERGGYTSKPGVSRPCIASSRLDSAASFCTFVESPEEKERLHNIRRSENANVVQPYIVVLGTPTNVQRCHVRFLDADIPVPSVVDAIDLCFKCFFVFNLEYPAKCLHIWTVIQELFYQVVCPGQKTTGSALHLLESLRKTLAQPSEGVDVVGELCVDQEGDVVFLYTEQRSEAGVETGSQQEESTLAEESAEVDISISVDASAEAPFQPSSEATFNNPSTSNAATQALHFPEEIGVSPLPQLFTPLPELVSPIPPTERVTDSPDENTVKIHHPILLPPSELSHRVDTRSGSLVYTNITGGVKASKTRTTAPSCEWSPTVEEDSSVSSSERSVAHILFEEKSDTDDD